MTSNVHLNLKVQYELRIRSSEFLPEEQFLSFIFKSLSFLMTFYHSTMLLCTKCSLVCLYRSRRNG